MLELDFDDVCVAGSPEAALRMVDHYGTTDPPPLAFEARVIADDPYEPGRDYPRKNWCPAHMRPRPLHEPDADCFVDGVRALGAIAMLRRKG